MKRLNSIIGTISRIFSMAAAAMIFAMMIVMTVEVTSRIAGTGAIPGSYGLVQLLLVGCIFFAAAHGERVGEHVRVDLLLRRLPEKAAAILGLLGNVVALGLVALMTVATGLRAAESFAVEEYQDGLGHFLVWPARFVITIGLAVLALELLMKILSRGDNATSGDPDDETTSLASAPASAEAGIGAS